MINPSSAVSLLLSLPRTLEDTLIYENLPPPLEPLVTFMSSKFREDQYSRADGDVQDWTDVYLLNLIILLWIFSFI